MSRPPSDPLASDRVASDRVASDQVASDPPGSSEIDRPLVTIVTPSFNHAAFIEATLRSVAEQDYPRIEHIVMDGGSTDGTVEILRGWAAHPMTWVSEPDRGQADAIARGFARSSGSILTWLNSDDTYLRADAVSRVVEQFTPGVRVVTACGAYIDATGNDLGPILLHPRIGHDDLRCVDTVTQPATFFERALLDEFPLDTSLHFAFDWDLFIRMSAVAPFKGLDLPIAGYRIHGAGKTETGGYPRQRELLKLMTRYRGRFHPATLALAAFAATYWVAGAFPPSLQRRHDRLMRRLAALSNQVTSGRGIAY